MLGSTIPLGPLGVRNRFWCLYLKQTVPVAGFRCWFIWATPFSDNWVITGGHGLSALLHPKGIKKRIKSIEERFDLGVGFDDAGLLSPELRCDTSLVTCEYEAKQPRNRA